MTRALTFFAALTLYAAAAPFAQDDPIDPIILPQPAPEGADIRIFRSVYNSQSPAFVATMRGVNKASMPIFISAVPLSALGTLAAGGDSGPTVRLLLSEGGTAGATFAMKFIFRRARPYVALEGVTQRQHEDPFSGRDPFSFPSGHAAFAFSLATSTSLSYPEWYVIAPAMTWASLTALARVWHGMHYPSDIVAGAALGAGTAVLVHLIFSPDGDDEQFPMSNSAPIFTYSLSF